MPDRVRWAAAAATGAGQPEVENLHPPLRRLDPQVARLDVAVDHAVRVGGRQSLRHLPTDTQHLRDRHGFLPMEPLIERLPLEKLHCQEGDAMIFAGIVDADDVIVLELRHHPSFAEKPLGGRPARAHARQHRLDRYGSFEHRILGPVDDAHAAVAQDLEDAIFAEPAEFALGLRRRQKRCEIGTLVGETVRERRIGIAQRGRRRRIALVDCRLRRRLDRGAGTGRHLGGNRRGLTAAGTFHLPSGQLILRGELLLARRAGERNHDHVRVRAKFET